VTATAYQRVVDVFRAEGLTVIERTHGKAIAQAPGHSPADRSIVITDIGGQVLLHSFSDPTDVVMETLRLRHADLFDEPRGTAYTYPDGRIVHRSPDKKFRQAGNTKGRALFHADRIGDAELVFVTEGEKCVLAIEAAGGTAVCNAMGAGKAHLFDWSPAYGKNMKIVADKDAAGRKHAAQVARLLNGIAQSVCIVEAKTGKDAADHIAAGHTLDEFAAVEGEPEGVRLWRPTDLKPAAPVRWLAKGRSPRGATSLLVGDEGIGKSLLWVWIVAALTTGRALPEFGIPARTPGHVVLVLTEDDWSATVRPRLEVAGADLSKIAVLCEAADGSGSPIFPRDMHMLDRSIEPLPVLIVVDAWLDTVSAGLSVRDPQQARQALHPWKELATRSDAAVLLLTHTNRVASANARDRYGATGELRKKASMTLFAQADEDGRLLVGPEKSNLVGPVNATTFTIEPVQHFDASEESDGTVPRLIYAGESDRTARDHIAEAFAAAPVEELDTHDYTADFKESWLYVYLSEAGKAKHKIRPKDAVAVGADKGHSRSSVFRLFDALAKAGRTQSQDGAGFPRITYWSAVDDTTGPVSPGADTAGTTELDLHKSGDTTALNDEPPWHCSRNAV
jgi:AAA domain/Toprim domain